MLDIEDRWNGALTLYDNSLDVFMIVVTVAFFHKRRCVLDRRVFEYGNLFLNIDFVLLVILHIDGSLVLQLLVKKDGGMARPAILRRLVQLPEELLRIYSDKIYAFLLYLFA